MAVKFNTDCAYTKSGYSGPFAESLKTVLRNITNDPNINNAKEAAYLLATAGVESNYSLQRWEADYVCGQRGVPYGSSGPCQKALNYYRSDKNKANYYNLGIDSKGFPYFGRGLIQLTGKGNYKRYGDIIGVDLIGNGDLALNPNNSYKIASAYMKARTFSKVNAGDLTKARKSVNGGTNGLEACNNLYNKWYKILTECGAQPSPGGSGITSDTSGGTGVNNANTNNSTQGQTNTPLSQQNQEKQVSEDEVVKLFASISSELIGNGTADQKTSKKEIKETKINTDFEAKQIIENTVQKDKINVKYSDHKEAIKKVNEA